MGRGRAAEGGHHTYGSGSCVAATAVLVARGVADVHNDKRLLLAGGILRLQQGRCVPLEPPV